MELKTISESIKYAQKCSLQVRWVYVIISVIVVISSIVFKDFKICLLAVASGFICWFLNARSLRLEKINSKIYEYAIKNGIFVSEYPNIIDKHGRAFKLYDVTILLFNVRDKNLKLSSGSFCITKTT